MAELVRHKAFGKPENPTIDYFTGYGGRIVRMRPHIAALTLAGFRVMAFEYDRAVLNAGDAALLPKAIDDIEAIIDRDTERHETAGVYGMSLGSLIGSNVLSRSDIKKGMSNTGLVSLLDVMWGNPRLASEKQMFVGGGHNYDSLAAAWADIDIDALTDRMLGKQIVLMASKADKYLDYDDAMQTADDWHQSGVDIEVVTGHFLDHGPAIFRNLFRFQRTIDFFKSPDLD